MFILPSKIAVLQSRVDTKDEDQGNWWIEQVEDLWTAKKLKHLWDIAKPYDYSDHQTEFTYDPEYGLYGYQVEAVKLQEKKEEEKSEPKTLPR